MATTQNVESVRRLYDVWVRGDFGSGLEAELFVPDVHVVIDIGPDPVDVRGIGAMSSAWRQLIEAFEGFHAGPIEDMAEVGDTIVVFNRVSGRGKRSGVDIDAPRAAIFTFQDGKVTSLVLTDRQTGREAAPTIGGT